MLKNDVKVLKMKEKPLMQISSPPIIYLIKTKTKQSLF